MRKLELVALLALLMGLVGCGAPAAEELPGVVGGDTVSAAPTATSGIVYDGQGSVEAVDPGATRLIRVSAGGFTPGEQVKLNMLGEQSIFMGTRTLTADLIGNVSEEIDLYGRDADNIQTGPYTVLLVGMESSRKINIEFQLVRAGDESAPAANAGATSGTVIVVAPEPTSPVVARTVQPDPFTPIVPPAGATAAAGVAIPTGPPGCADIVTLDPTSPETLAIAEAFLAAGIMPAGSQYSEVAWARQLGDYTALYLVFPDADPPPVIMQQRGGAWVLAAALWVGMSSEDVITAGRANGAEIPAALIDCPF
jgi:hypothetical protein